MTNKEKDLRDQLALSELDPDSDAYRQMRLSLTLARFKAGRNDSDERKGDANIDGIEELLHADSERRSRDGMSSDDIDLIETLNRSEVDEELEHEDEFADEICEDSDENNA